MSACGEKDCHEMRNVIADVYELVIKALEEIILLEDSGIRSDTYCKNRAIQIAGNARLAVMYKLADYQLKRGGKQ